MNITKQKKTPKHSNQIHGYQGEREVGKEKTEIRD